MELSNTIFRIKIVRGRRKLKDARTEVIKNLIKAKSPSIKAFAESIELPYTTLRSMLERGIGNASVDNVIRVCKGLGITIEELETMASEGGVTTIAAHHDGEDWTEEELDEIERFKEFVKLKRNKEK